MGISAEESDVEESDVKHVEPDENMGDGPSSPNDATANTTSGQAHLFLFAFPKKHQNHHDKSCSYKVRGQKFSF